MGLISENKNTNTNPNNLLTLGQRKQNAYSLAEFMGRNRDMFVAEKLNKAVTEDEDSIYRNFLSSYIEGEINMDMDALRKLDEAAKTNPDLHTVARMFDDFINEIIFYGMRKKNQNIHTK